MHETDLPSGIERHHVAYPLRKGGELLAVLEVSADGALHGRPLETLRLLAQVAAEAISNARLHQHTAAQAASLEMLSHQLIDAHQAEQATRQEVEELNEKLMGADQLKNQLLNTTSHELRTPLSSILGYLDLILDEHAESVAEEREFVGEARRCAEHLLHLINDILDISRIEAGNLSIVPGSVDIHALMDDVRSTIAPQARQKNIELHVQCHDELLALADFRRARQALLNLTANAVKFTEKGSVALTAHDNGDAIQITVSDTGIGVSEADRANVFEPFFQSDSSNNRAYPGTGLGLAITKRLVQLMGGEVRLEERQAAVGSAFSMTLPKNVISEIRQPTRGGVS